MKRRCWGLVLVVLVVDLWGAAAARATGQGPSDSIVERTLRSAPDDVAAFLDGKLGILGPTLWRRWRAVAYRVIAGTPLDKASRASLDPPLIDYDKTATARWDALRKTIADPKPPTQTYYDPSYCYEDAFATALETLRARRQKFGVKSKEVAEWLSGQDAVFSRCSSGDKPPLPASKVPVGLDPLVQRDRDYQVAAALFYNGQFAEARAAFDHVVEDKQSPWVSLARLAAARTLLREGVKGDAADKALLDEGKQRLEKILADPSSSSLHRSARRLVRFAEFWSRGNAQLAPLSQLIEKGNDPDYGLAQIDLGRLLDKIDVKSSSDLAAYDGQDLVAWTLAWDLPDGERRAYARDRWSKKKTTAWLLLALSDAAPDDKELFDAARAIKLGPAYVTAGALRARSLLAQNRLPAARALLDELVTAPALPDDTANELRRMRFGIAANVDDAMRFAMRAANDGSPMLALPAQLLFFRHLPVAQTLAAMRHPALASHPAIRDRLLRIAWVRAMVVDDLPTVKSLTEIADTNDASLAKWRAATTPDERAFEFALVWQGTQWETDPLDYWDLFDTPETDVPPRFVDAATQKRAKGELDAFAKKLVNASSWRANQIAAHAADPRLPAALALAVAQTKHRNASVASKRAYLVLHKLYPNSPEAKKTKYWW